MCVVIVFRCVVGGQGSHAAFASFRVKGDGPLSRPPVETLTCYETSSTHPTLVLLLCTVHSIDYVYSVAQGSERWMHRRRRSELEDSGEQF